MIRINLLPHREERRRRQNIQIGVLAGLAAVLGAVIVGAVHIGIVTQIDYQNGRNGYLKREIAVLDKQIDEIKKLKEQTQQLLARKKVVEALQVNRSDTVHVLDQLARRLPDGIYLKAVKQTGTKLNVVGYAQSNARVSTLMRNIESSPWLENPTLVEIKAVNVNKQRLNEFNLNMQMKRRAEEVAGEPKPGATKAAAAAAKPPATPASTPASPAATKSPVEIKK
jgi:type IV pilus assembly protein PilN